MEQGRIKPVERSTKFEASSSSKRKQLNPSKAPSRDDSNFRGCIVTSELKLVNGEWKLVETTEFQPPSLSRRWRRRQRMLQRKMKRLSMCEDEDDSDESPQEQPVTQESPLRHMDHVEKHCASCSAKKTPLWRDAEDGTPLCNACGIRYKKYKIRCARCWHIPKKDEFSPLCKFCGSKFQYSYPKAW